MELFGAPEELEVAALKLRVPPMIIANVSRARIMSEIFFLDIEFADSFSRLSKYKVS